MKEPSPELSKELHQRITAQRVAEKMNGGLQTVKQVDLMYTKLFGGEKGELRYGNT